MSRAREAFILLCTCYIIYAQQQPPIAPAPVAPQPAAAVPAASQPNIVYSCDRQPLKKQCPDGRNSQFTLRWFLMNGTCMSYPWGHCKQDNLQAENSIRTQADCEAICIRHEVPSQGLRRSRRQQPVGGVGAGVGGANQYTGAPSIIPITNPDNYQNTQPSVGPVTQAPITQPPVTQPPVTQPPVTQGPGTYTNPPTIVTQPPVTQPPVGPGTYTNPPGIVTGATPGVTPTQAPGYTAPQVPGGQGVPSGPAGVPSPSFPGPGPAVPGPAGPGPAVAGGQGAPAPGLTCSCLSTGPDGQPLTDSNRNNQKAAAGSFLGAAVQFEPNSCINGQTTCQAQPGASGQQAFCMAYNGPNNPPSDNSTITWRDCMAVDTSKIPPNQCLNLASFGLPQANRCTCNNAINCNQLLGNPPIVPGPIAGGGVIINPGLPGPAGPAVPTGPAVPSVPSGAGTPTFGPSPGIVPGTIPGPGGIPGSGGVVPVPGGSGAGIPGGPGVPGGVPGGIPGVPSGPGGAPAPAASQLSCNRAPFRTAPCRDGSPPQFTLRWFLMNGQCMTYPWGHCKGDDLSTEGAIRTQDVCVAVCINGQPPTLLGTPGPGFPSGPGGLPPPPGYTGGPIPGPGGSTGGGPGPATQAPVALSCDRIPYRKTACPDGRQPQFTLRWFNMNGQCMSYPWGHCKQDELSSEPGIRNQEDCVAICVNKQVPAGFRVL